MQLRRPRQAKQLVPRLRPEPHHAGQVSVEIAEANGAQQRGELGAKGAHRLATGSTAGQRHDLKDRGARQGLHHRLGDGRHVICCGCGQ
jgi:hypothetical protein